ncbi:MAG: DNA-processing protein DprA [Eubacterium sp.]
MNDNSINNREKCEFVCSGDAGFPERLDRFLTGKGRVEKLYYRGDLSLAGKLSIAVVGSRDCSPYGMSVAKEIGRLAAEYGVVVISGLARGIDSAAQRSVLDAGGISIGVIANGLDIYYPPENRDLQEKISRDGLLLSEYPPGERARGYYFPLRNRIISALADAVVVVEAGTRSGALITAECAEEQGKTVFAVPGNIVNPRSFGTNKLIQDKADIVVSCDDIFKSLGCEISAKKKKYQNLGGDEKKIVDALAGCGEMSIDALSCAVDMDVSDLNSLITIMEIKGVLACEMGKIFIADL